ncbi:MAG: hypothetical protein BMS9Abin30_0795 [Gammaproteobacteria bacterium]|nr:MAG: hypothetical protein BMS9Abin30_0795 [Gammaproteobacteria bacterium]
MKNHQSIKSSVSPDHSAKISKHPTIPKKNNPRPIEVGGPKGPEPTRYGDWEQAGRCTDF